MITGKVFFEFTTKTFERQTEWELGIGKLECYSDNQLYSCARRARELTLGKRGWSVLFLFFGTTLRDLPRVSAGRVGRKSWPSPRGRVWASRAPVSVHALD